MVVARLAQHLLGQRPHDSMQNFLQTRALRAAGHQLVEHRTASPLDRAHAVREDGGDHDEQPNQPVLL